MNVKEFKNLVNEIPDEFDERVVIVQRDQEGNGYDRLRGIDWSDLVWIEEDKEITCQVFFDDQEEWDSLIEKLDETQFQKCIILYP